MKKIKELYKKIKRKIDYKDIIIFLIPFIMFGIYLVVLYPGVLSYDSYNQLTQIKNMTFTSSHPFFHTFIEMILMKLVNTPAIIGLFQITFFSILWSRICKYNRLKHNRFDFSYQVVLTVFLSVNPLNKVMSITLWKDILYSYIILLLSFEMEKLIDNKFKVDLKKVIELALLLMVLPNLRHNGYLITLSIGIILFIIFIIKDRKDKVKEKMNYNYLKLIGFMLIFFLCFKGLNEIYKVDEGLSVTGVGSIIDYKVLAVTGEIGRYGKYTEEDKKKIEKYVDFDCIVEKTKFNSLDHMWVSCNSKEDVMKKDRINMYKTVFSMMSKNLKVSIKFYLKEWGYIWRIVRYKESWGNINYYGIDSGGIWDINYKRPFQNSKLYLAITRYLYFTRNNVFFQTIFYSGSLCLYLSIAILICLKKKYKVKMLLVFLPTVINTLGIGLTASVNDVRYYYSNFLVLYLLGAILIKYWVKDAK